MKFSSRILLLHLTLNLTQPSQLGLPYPNENVLEERIEWDTAYQIGNAGVVVAYWKRDSSTNIIIFIHRDSRRISLTFISVIMLLSIMLLNINRCDLSSFYLIDYDKKLLRWQLNNLNVDSNSRAIKASAFMAFTLQW